MNKTSFLAFWTEGQKSIAIKKHCCNKSYYLPKQMVHEARFLMTTLLIKVWLCFLGKLNYKIFYNNSKLTFLKSPAFLIPFEVSHVQTYTKVPKTT